MTNVNKSRKTAEKPVFLDSEVSSASLARIVGVTAARIRQLAADLPRGPGGGYLVGPSIRALFRRQAEAAAGRSGDLAAERAALAREQREAVALKNRRARGEVVELDAVTRRWDAAMASIQSRMLSLPTEASQRLQHLTRTDVETLDRLVRDALTEAADGVDALDDRAARAEVR